MPTYDSEAKRVYADIDRHQEAMKIAEEIERIYCTSVEDRVQQIASIIIKLQPKAEQIVPAALQRCCR